MGYVSWDIDPFPSILWFLLIHLFDGINSMVGFNGRFLMIMGYRLQKANLEPKRQPVAASSDLRESTKRNAVQSVLDPQIYPLVNIPKTMENCPFIVIFPLKIVIFHSYVSLPEGTHDTQEIEA